MLNQFLDVKPEVAEALAAGKPVVALESTIISHGMPYPQNVETALEVERIIRENGLQGHELVGFGDGFVEIENVKERGGFAVGVATDEKHHDGRVDAWKRERLIRAGADIIIPDFARAAELAAYLFPQG
mgnify:CR=1 FL=1